MNNSEASKFEFLFKFRRSKFWREVSRFKKKKTLNSRNLNIEKFEEFYSNCFDSKHATPIPKHGIIELEVLKRIDDLKNIKYDVNFTIPQIESAIKQLNKGKAFGFDSVSAEMLIYSDSVIMSPILAKFYS